MGVLPAFAFLDVVNPHRRLHICHLVGTVPIWSWTVTPAAYTALLPGKDPSDGTEDYDAESNDVRPCHLDGFGETPPLMAIDGRHGYQYVVANAKTLRCCLSVSPRRPISNQNTGLKDESTRAHRLEIIRVSPRLPGTSHREWSSSSNGITLGGLLPGSRKLRVDSTARLTTIITSGWVILAGCLGAALKTQCFLGAAYLIIVSLTGLCIQILYGSQPRTLIHDSPSGVNRMVVVAEHSNTTSWKAFYGDSSLLKSLLKHPLTSEYSSLSKQQRKVLQILLRGLILGQWVIALSAAVSKDASGILVFFWVLVSNMTFRYLATPTMGAHIWMRSYAGIVIERYQLKLSCRLSLLSTLVALNPDTPPLTTRHDTEAISESSDPMGWLDTVWRDNPSRRHWEETLRKALTETFQKFPVSKVASSGHKNEFWQTLGFSWQSDKKGESKAGLSSIIGKTEAEDWLPSVQEGLNMAARVQAEAERLVTRSNTQNDDDVEEVKILI